MPPAATTVRLQQLLASLTDEVAAWTAIADGNTPVGNGRLSAEEARRFAPHRSQIRHLEKFFDGIGKQLNADIGDGQAVAGSTGDRILQVHAIWDWFRAKLLLRYSPTLSPWLFAADELAWVCLRPLAEARANALADAPGEPPVQDAAVLKVPPLIYLGRAVSPFVYPRGWTLESQIPGIDDGLYLAVLQQAPFALVSMPYYETAHLAETLVLAHEVGHVVDLDLGLSGALDRALAAAAGAFSDGHLDVWQRWRLEAFADVFGAASGGLGFCRALADFLQRDGIDIANEPVKADSKYDYPTRYLRVLLVLEVLRPRGGTLPEGAEALLAQWQDAHGRGHTGVAFVADLPVVVGSFLDTQLPELGGWCIRDLTASDTRDSDATADAERLLERIRPSAKDPRTLFAAATLAFAADPARYRDNKANELVLERVRAVAEDKPRSGLTAAPADLDATGRAGADLARLLHGGR